MDIVEQMRSFESDHEPGGWPAVTMGQISALCDEIERLNSAWQVETLNRKDLLIAKQEAENDRLKSENTRLQLLLDQERQESLTASCSVAALEMELDSAKSMIDELQKRFMDASVDRNLLQGVINEQPSPRITEHETRIIVESAIHHYIFSDKGANIDNWIEDEGRDLLAKLNEAKHD